MDKGVATYETDEDTVCSGDDEDEPNESVDKDTDTDNHSRYTSRLPPAKVTSLPIANSTITEKEVGIARTKTGRIKKLLLRRTRSTVIVSDY